MKLSLPHILSGIGKGAGRMALGAFTCAALLTAPASAQDITTGLVGHWKLDELTGTTASDSAGSNNGTMNGGLDAANDSSAGIIGTGLTFDGSDDYIIPASDIYDGLAELTVTAWVKQNAAELSGVGNIFGRITSGGSQGGFELRRQNLGSDVFACEIDDGPDSVEILSQVNEANTADVWQHVACTFKANQAGGLKLYIDGVENNTAVATTLVDNTGNGPIPRISESGGSAWGGSIDDVRIYDRALSDEDIAVLASGTAPGGIRYNDETEGLEYHDGYEWFHTGLGSYSANGVTFDGTNDHLEATVSPPDSKRWSGSLWFRRNLTTGTQYIMRAGSGRLTVGFLNSNNKLFIDAQSDSSTDVLFVEVDTVISDNDWHHLMFSFDLTDTGKRHIYVDGAAAATTYTTYTDDIMDFSSAQKAIGAAPGGATKLDGDLADLWMDFGTYIDLSVQGNREKFISANSAPMYLGTDGSLPLGRTPDIFLTGATDEWHTNKGTGGGFTENGSLTDAATQPGDTPTVPTHCSNIGNICTDGSVYAGQLSGTDLFVPPVDSPTTLPWNNGNWSGWTTTGVTSTTDGASNTATLITLDSDSSSGGVQPHQAAQFCADLTAHGHTDWYLPARDELNVLYTNGVAIGGFDYDNLTGYYWSSTEDNQFDAWMRKYSSTFENGINKAVSYHVRCVRQSVAVATCSNPSEPKGSIIYNTDDKVMQYCNGVDWVAMGPVGGTGGGGCASPAGSAGDFIFNEDWDVLQFCNSEDWVAAGESFNIIPTDNMIGYWPLDELSGTTANATVGPNGTMANGLNATNDSIGGKVSRAIDLDGSNDYINLGQTASIMNIFKGDSDGTMCLWFNSDQMTAGNTEEYTLLSMVYISGTYAAFQVNSGWGNERLRLKLNNSWSADTMSSSDFNLQTNTWYHACLTNEIMSTSNTQAKIYLNGVLRNTRTMNRTRFPDPGDSGNVEIGRERIAGSTEFDGTLDDVRMYDRVLTRKEIYRLYNATK